MSRARAARKSKLGDLVATAQSRFNRVTARKVRMLADAICGLTVAEADQQLAALHRPSAMPVVSNLLKSAVANAKEKEEDHPEELVIGEIFADAGPMLKRFRPAPMGRGVRVRKRMSHVTIKLFKQG